MQEQKNDDCSNAKKNDFSEWAQELNAKVDQLETENALLKSQVTDFDELKAEVEALKNAVYGTAQNKTMMK